MRLLFITLFMLLGFSEAAKSQKIDNDSLIQKIKSEITAFFIQEGYLNKSEVKENINFVFATEIGDRKVLGYNVNGIYRIGVLQSHSKTHILIKQDCTFKIFNLKEINTALREIINYSEKVKIDNDLMFFYLKEIMAMYDFNYKMNN